MRRRLRLLLAPAAVAGLLAAHAEPATAGQLRPCPDLRGVLCARVTVPLDRAGTLPGSVRLFVQRLRNRPRRRQVLLALAGGPGQAASPLLESFADVLAPALRQRELVVFDQRGTGRSGLLRCPSVERASVADPIAAGAACAQRLGPARAFHTTRDSIADVEAVRVALGVEKLSLFAVSYGTKVALGYAIAHPDRVDRLVLDSPVDAEGPDVYSRSGFAAVPGVLRDTCRGRRCTGITSDPLGDLAALAAQLRTAPLGGVVIGPRGQRRPAILRASDLLGLLFTSDIDPLVLPALPAAVQGARGGDAAPVLRLARQAAAAQAPGPPGEFSTGLLVATLCEELPFPWGRSDDVAQRRHALGAALQALGDGPFAPFDRTAAIALSIMPACYGWPTGPAAPAFATAPLPASPALLVNGTHDLRTPLSDARDLAARMPGARVLATTGAGHSVLSTSEAGCPARALGAFFAGRPVPSTCPRDRELDVPPLPLAPRSLRDVPPIPRVPGRAGRTLGAVLMTLDDAFFSALALDAESQADSVGGLRGGFLAFDADGLVIRNLVYVPGVRVSGRARFVRGELTIRLRVAGRAASPGRITIAPGGLLTGHLGGRRIRLRPRGAAAAGSATAARAVVAIRLRERRSGGRPIPGRPPLAPWRTGSG